MAIAAISQRECLRDWRKWTCRVQCGKACKASSFRHVKGLLSVHHDVVAALNALSVFEASIWRVVTEGGNVLTDQNGTPLVWPKGDA